jgi:hypothetical protein
VIASRRALHAAWKEAFVPWVASIFVKYPEIGAVGNDDLIVMPCNSHWLVEDLSEYLIEANLHMTKNEQFEDFAIVHGKYGIPMPCAWLDYNRIGEKGTVEFKPANDPLNLEPANVGYEGAGWIVPRGHGFVISSDDEYDVWLDFLTGQTVVTLHPPNSIHQA